MDRSFSSPHRGAYSPLGRQNISSRRSLAPNAFKNSSRFSTSGLSGQSVQVLLKSQCNYVERFGANLPVLITEALTFAERNTVVSARISDCGFAWVVCGRRLLVWQYKQSDFSRRSAISSQCFELQLPQSGLAHRAELVTVFVQPGTHLASCIAVSPEGVMRYWAAVVHESVYIETSVDLQGQECDSITSIDGLGCILATTTCTIVIVKAENLSGRPNLTCKTLKMPSGWLGGISRRMSSLFFGPINTEHNAETRLVRVLSVPTSENEWILYVLAGHSLQKWKLSKNSEQLIFASDLTQIAQNAMKGAMGEPPLGERPETLTFLLDIQAENTYQITGNCNYQNAETCNLVILAANVNTQISPQINYGLIKINAEQAPNCHLEYVPVKLNCFYREENACENLSYRLLICNNTCYVYNKKSILVVNDEPDLLEFTSVNDFILGGSVCVNSPVFFSRCHGLVVICQNEGGNFEFLNETNVQNVNFDESLNTNNLTLYHLDGDEISNAHKDTMGQFKAALVFHVQNNKKARDEILFELFPRQFNENLKARDNLNLKNLSSRQNLTSRQNLRENVTSPPNLSSRQNSNVDDSQLNQNELNSSLKHSTGNKNVLNTENLNEVNAILDQVIVNSAYELLNDVPASDPRWSGQGDIGLGSSHSMQIPRLLEDKQMAFNLFVKFLKETSLFDSLGGVAVRGVVMATGHVLGELAEQILAVICLKKLPQNDVVQNAIRQAVEVDCKQLQNGLTYWDVFYCKITQCYRAFQEMVEYCEQLANSDMDPAVVAQKICETNEILLTVLKEVITFRLQTSDYYGPHIPPTACEYVPWTASQTHEGLYNHLMQQQNLTYKYGVKVTADRVLCNTLYDQLVFLIDILLDARKSHLQSLKQKSNVHVKQYEKDREKLIKPLIDDKEYERALILSEKYLDFTNLIEICEITNNNVRLDEYIERFQKENFALFLYNYYLKREKRGLLLEKARKNKKLQVYLQKHPTLSWMQNIQDGDFSRASTSLLNLAENETNLIMRKKTMLSFAKLTKLISLTDNLNDKISSKTEKNDEIIKINNCLNVISYQEEIPDYVLEQFGYNTTNPSVISIKDLINLYICPEFRDSSEVEFKKALDLLNFVENDSLRLELQLAIWKNAVLRDSWHDLNLETIDPIECLQHKLFFKLAELCVNLGCDSSVLLPPIDVLIEDDDLSFLQENKSFQFLIKFAYEKISVV